MKQYWLMKSEPDVYSITDLERDRTTSWTGVRNYQARNFMRDAMKVGDEVLFYHSNAEPPGVAGLARVVRLAHPDRTALDPGSDYYDPKATEENPIWMHVDVGHVRTFPQVVTLDTLKADPALDGLMVTKRGMRLSVQPVSAAHFARIVQLAGTRKA
ncbi:MAG TPA: EVE domain-containing protein [Kiritimatiellia bacterium]|nr:EVE domain-containing protein [Kiritimatiellia bacterium]HMP34599.1 EVE domain-containing protein [Kiritimatiellia bacterium]